MQRSFYLLPALMLLLACSAQAAPLGYPSQQSVTSEPVQPLVEFKNLNFDKVMLGKRLFHDPGLSGDNTISCSSCHNLRRGGADDKKFSFGVNAQLGVINTPTVLNSAYNFAQFWDGRAKTLEQQIDGPIANPIEMNSDWETVIERLERNRYYAKTFSKLYQGGVSELSIKDAIATFERSLTTLNARFDRYLKGESDAITLDESKGYQLFKAFGCASCHQGRLLGGNMYEKMGLMRDYFKERGNITSADFGRFNQTEVPEHKFEFKVPSLRNIELTAPYFHDGSANTLPEAVKVMARYNLGREINKEETALIVAFLKTLTGELPEHVR